MQDSLKAACIMLHGHLFACSGDYPLNELGQQMYPRRHFFEQAAAVMATAGRYPSIKTCTRMHTHYHACTQASTRTALAPQTSCRSCHPATDMSKSAVQELCVCLPVCVHDSVCAYACRSVPVFIDKYLASSMEDAQWMCENAESPAYHACLPDHNLHRYFKNLQMQPACPTHRLSKAMSAVWRCVTGCRYARAQQLAIPFMAGSSVPICFWRNNRTAGAGLHQAVSDAASLPNSPFHGAAVQSGREDLVCKRFGDRASFAHH